MSSNSKHRKKLNQVIALAAAGLIYQAVSTQLCEATEEMLYPSEKQVTAAYFGHQELLHMLDTEVDTEIGKMLGFKKTFEIVIKISLGHFIENSFYPNTTYRDPIDVIEALVAGKESLNKPSVTRETGEHGMFADGHSGNYITCKYPLNSNNGYITIYIEK